MRTAGTATAGDRGNCRISDNLGSGGDDDGGGVMATAVMATAVMAAMVVAGRKAEGMME